jgi:hypothetical protein
VEIVARSGGKKDPYFNHAFDVYNNGCKEWAKDVGVKIKKPDAKSGDIKKEKRTIGPFLVKVTGALSNRL